MLIVLLAVVVVFIVWLSLTMSALASLRRARRAPGARSPLGLVMAVVPVLIGYFLFRFNLRISFNAISANVSWLFAIPIVIGIVAIIFWFRPTGATGNAGRDKLDVS